MPTYNMLDAKSNLSRLVEAVESGTEAEIIIARNGRPAARLVPIEVKVDTSRRLGVAEGKYPELSSLSLEEFNARGEEIAALFYGEID